jgi:formate-dependent nitrite reductase membrane component NrfD
LNEPVWEWSIPTYYYIGGLAGAALVLGAATEFTRRQDLECLVKRCHRVGFFGCCISGALLIYDLGRPSRFFNMLRVFRPTSPMNVGTWILSCAGGTSMMSVIFRGRSGFLGPIGKSASYLSGTFGMALATYTGVLISNTAIPVWQESRRIVPLLFAASSMASVGSLFGMIAGGRQERRITKTFGTIGQLAEIAAGIAMERQVSRVPRVGLPLNVGVSGAMWKTAALLTATSFVAGALPNPSRARRIAAGVLGTLGCLLMRFAIERAGVASARDARASFHQQRAGSAH